MHKTWNKHNIYVIPSGEQLGFKRDDVVNLIYSPLAGKFFLATEEETKKIKSDLEEDINSDLLNSLKCYKYPWEKQGYHRNINDYSKLYIILNQKCNFSCTYCYAASGRSSKEATFEQIAQMLDYFFSPNSSKESKRSIVFIGGGEPLLSWDLLEKSVLYAEQKARLTQKDLFINITTNTSLFDDSKIRFLLAHNISLTCSFDILPDIQNKQRGHYDIVATNLKKLLSAGVNAHIQATITPSAIAVMPNMVDEISKHFPGIRVLKMEMVWDSQVLKSRESVSKYITDFYTAYGSARQKATEKNIDIFNSFVNAAQITRDRYCGGAFVFTPEGKLSACPYVSASIEKGYEKMIYGNITDNGPIVITHKIQAFLNYKAENHSKCQDCYAKWNCGGGCPNAARIYSLEVLSEICRQTRHCLLNELLERLKTEFYKKNSKTLLAYLHEQISEKD